MFLRIIGLTIAILLNILLTDLTLAAQTVTLPRLGWLSVSSAGASPRNKAFLQGLRDLGYVEGQNIVIEHLSAQGEEDRLADLARELVRRKVDIIVVLEPPAAQAVKEATATIPIVMRSTDDPVRAGFVGSLARPGGNVTGLASISRELTGKWLELLKDVIPGISRVAVLWNPGRPGNVRNFKDTEVAASTLGIQIQSLEVRDPNDLDSAFEKASGERAGGLITLRTPVIVIHRKRVAELANKRRLPAVYDDREFVQAGGLMSYGTDLAVLYRRAATYVNKILKGARPGDLPVEQPTKFELVINLKTARALGLKVPAHLLMEANKVIE